MTVTDDVQTTADTASRGWEALYSDLERLGTELGQLSRDCVGLGSERLVEEFGRLKSTSGEILTKARSTTAGFSGSAAGYARSNPFVIALAAFGVGTTLALLLAK